MSIPGETDAENIDMENQMETEEVDRPYYALPIEIYDESDPPADFDETGSEEEASYTQLDDHTFALSAEVTDKEESIRKISHSVLEALGKIPVTGESFDLMNAALYSLEGDKANAQRALASSVPIVGDIELGEYSEEVHTVLDVAGFFPALGAIPDGINALFYLKEGDVTNVGLSAVAMIPVAGDGIKGASMAVKYGGKLEKATKTVSKARKKTSSAWIKRFSGDELMAMAEKIVREAKAAGAKRIAFLWTNGTKYNAKALVKEIKKIAPKMDISVHQLECERLGIQMEKWVNRRLVEAAQKLGHTPAMIKYCLKNNKLWDLVFHHSLEEARHMRFRGVKETKYTLEELKDVLEKFQRRVSRKYAHDIKPTDFVIRVKQPGKPLGQASRAEEILLREAKPNGVDKTLLPGKGTEPLNRRQYIHRND